MNAGSVLAIARLENAAVCMQSPVPGQQRGVDVEHAPGVALDELLREHAHEARKNDEVGPASVDGFRQLAFELAAAGSSAPWDGAGSIPRLRATAIPAASARS